MFVILSAVPPDCLRKNPGCVDSMVAISSGKEIREDDLIIIGEIKLENETQFFSVIRRHLLDLIGDPMLSMLEMRAEDVDPSGVETVTMLVASANFKNNPKVS